MPEGADACSDAVPTGSGLLAQLKAQPDGFVSGAVLGDILGVSRTAIWKQIQALRAEGYGITSQPRHGYRLDHLPAALNVREVEAGLDTAWLGRPLQVLEEADSTNRVAMNTPRWGHGAVVAARQQVAGRGRLGRVWSTPPGTLAFSMVLIPDMAPRRAPILTLATAVGLVDGVAACCGLQLDIKWPNDLLWQGRKVAGILTELRSDPDRIIRAVVGVGLNVNTAADDFDPEVRERATSLATALDREVPMATLLPHVLGALEPIYERLCDPADPQAEAALLARYRVRCATLGQAVTVTGTPSFEGVAEAVDEEGALMVVKADGTRVRVFSGDVTLSAAASRPVW